MDSSDIFDTASQEGEEEYEEELSAAEVVLRSNYHYQIFHCGLFRLAWFHILGILLEFYVKRFILKVLAKLEEAWINERNSPELLHPRMEMVGSISHGQDGR